MIVTCPARSDKGVTEALSVNRDPSLVNRERHRVTNDKWRDENQRRFLGEGTVETFVSGLYPRTQFLPAALAA